MHKIKFKQKLILINFKLLLIISKYYKHSLFNLSFEREKENTKHNKVARARRVMAINQSHAILR